MPHPCKRKHECKDHRQHVRGLQTASEQIKGRGDRVGKKIIVKPLPGENIVVRREASLFLDAGNDPEMKIHIAIGTLSRIICAVDLIQGMAVKADNAVKAHDKNSGKQEKVFFIGLPAPVQKSAKTREVSALYDIKHNGPYNHENQSEYMGENPEAEKKGKRNMRPHQENQSGHTAGP